MAEDFEFSIKALFKDAASRGLKSLRRQILKVNRAVRQGGLSGLLGTGGRTLFGDWVGRARAGRPGGLGGIFAGVVQGATRILTLPARIVQAFSKIIPGIGDAFSSAIGTATNILEGLLSAAANIAGGIVNIFTSMVRRVVSLVGKLAGKVAKILGGIGIGAGALFVWQFVKGIRENMRLADLRQVLQKLLGDAAKEAERYARKLSLETPFTPEQMIEAVAGIAAVEKRYKRFLENLADWAAGADKPLQQIIEVFQRAQTGQFGEAMEGARRALISLKDLQKAGLEFGAGNRFQGRPAEFVAGLMRAVEARFGGMAEAAAEVGKGPWSTFIGAVQSLRIELTEPWYRKFNQALKDMNEYLLDLAGSASWDGIIAASRSAARSFDLWLRRTALPALKSAGRAVYNFAGNLASRDWSLKGLKRAFRAIPSVVGTAVSNAWDNVRHYLPQIRAQVLIWIEKLWGSIGKRLAGGLNRFFDQIAAAPGQKLQEIGEEIRNRKIATLQKRLEQYEPGAATGTPRSLRRQIEKLRSRPASSFLNYKEAYDVGVSWTKIMGLQELHSAMQGMSGIFQGLALNAGDAERRIAELQQELERLQQRPAPGMQATGRALRELLETAAPREGGRKGFDKAAAVDREVAARRRLEQTPAYQRGEDLVGRMRRRARNLRETGRKMGGEVGERMVQEARAMAQEASRMREKLEKWAARVTEDLRITRQEHARLKQMVERLSISR